jgi:hypothetical protein
VIAVKKALGLLVGLFLLGSNSGLAQSRISTPSRFEPGITVVVQNPAQVPPKALARTEEVAGSILSQAGVKVRWLDCDLAALAQDLSDCAQPLRPNEFVLAVVGKLQTLSPELATSTLGFALVPSEGRQGYRAYVSYDHARDISQRTHVEVDRVLGVGVAHELGHLLLGESAHSSTGIMKILWQGNEMRAGLNWNMLFTPQQSKRIQSNVQSRRAASEILVLKPVHRVPL